MTATNIQHTRTMSTTGLQNMCGRNSFQHWWMHCTSNSIKINLSRSHIFGIFV